MEYKDVTNWLFSQLAMYQNVGKIAYKANLNNTLKLAKYLNNPETKFKSIHVGGTNGKGSTSHMLASVLQEAGYKVGLYTSPHLKDFRERIKINGDMISERNVIDFVTKHQEFFKANQLSFFEMTVGMAFDFFANKKVDIAIIEVGLGGRLDSTNIITPEISVITNIGLDHTQFLGTTLSQIAKEKAGIIKPNIPCVIGNSNIETKPIFENTALQNNSPIYFSENDPKCPYQTDLSGNYQQENIKTAFKTINLLLNQGWVIPVIAITNGLLSVVKNTGLQGRWQTLNTKPLIICDTAHNYEGLQWVVKQIDSEPKEYLHIVIGMVSDKNIERVLSLFPKNATYYFTKPNNLRALSEIELQHKASLFQLKGTCYSTVNEALKKAKENATNQDMIYIGGSTFVVSEII